MRWFPLASCSLGLLGLSVSALAQPPTNAYALTGVRIEVGDGRVIEKGTVLIRHGLIEAVGPNVAVPPDAEVIKGDGMTVYPGFVDTEMTGGLTLPDPKPDQDKAPDTSAEAPASMREANRKGIRPELRAADCLTLTDALLAPIHQAGFTTALIVPTGGNMNGCGTLVNLSGLPKRDSVVKEEILQDFAFGGGRRGFGQRPAGPPGYPGSLLGVIALTRQTLLDAQHFQALQTAFASGSGQRPPADDSLVALQAVLNGTQSVLFDAESEKEIHRALALADEFQFHLLIGGGAEAWKVAPLLAQRKIPVLVSLNFGDEPGVQRRPASGSAPGGGGPRTGRGRRFGNGGAGGAPGGAPPGPAQTPPLPAGGPPAGTTPPGGAPGGNRPAAPAEEDPTPKAVVAEQHRLWEERIANAAKLQQAGVPFAFSTKGLRTPGEFLDNLRRAIQAGLPKDVALQALTLNAAKLLGVEKQMGTVEAGKIADLIVMTGDFTDARSRVRYLFIDTAKFDTETDTTPRPGAPVSFPAEEDEDE